MVKNIDDGKINGVLLVDLSKAFDTVNHEILLWKLKSIGCSNVSLKWFRSYLADRKQKVAFKSYMSESLDLEMGVPQGSILGPLLFSIFINDLPNVMNEVQVDMYADDTTIYTAATDINIISARMNEAVIKLNSWLHKNKL